MRTSELVDVGGESLGVGDLVEVIDGGGPDGLPGGTRAVVRQVGFAGWRRPPRMHCRVDDRPELPDPGTGVWLQGNQLRKVKR